MMNRARTKIICTLGPASGNLSVMRKMMLSGMDIARLNSSHGTHAEFKSAVRNVRSLNRKYRRKVGILLDLEGHRIRIGDLEKPVQLMKRQVIALTNNPEEALKGAIPFDYRGKLSDIRIGGNIFIDDGNIDVKVIARTARRLKCAVVSPGLLKSRKGMNIPGSDLKFDGLTEKDKADIAFAMEQGVDYIAQSFVRFRRDVQAVRDLIKHSRPACGIIAKIENHQGVRNIDEILEAADGIMIARGDMGVSLPVYEVPVIQKELIKKCNRAGKFVITATQMLESMVENARPTRAEVSDVANAVLDGTDMVMLSAETAVGKYPAQTVALMNKIIQYTENWG